MSGVYDAPSWAAPVCSRRGDTLQPRRNSRRRSVWSTPFRTDRSSVDPKFGMQEVPVATGTIKKVVADRGFGFIVAEDAKEYFFHRSSVDATLDFDRLAGGEAVEFEVEASPKGPRAANVRAA